MKTGRSIRIVVVLLLLTGGGLLLCEQAWLAIKAHVAAEWIDDAFEAHLADGEPHRPWSWADTHPVARLEAPRLGIRRTVLSGATGSSLAFGPGHVHGSAPPNGAGNCVLAGHRDSWFAFLHHLRVGEEIRLQTREGTRRYAVAGLEVVSMWDLDATSPSSDDRLTLITCYPFGGLTRSEWRYVVHCEPQRAQRGRRRDVLISAVRFAPRAFVANQGS